MGDKEIILDKYSNIYVDDIKYEGTSGLWHLIMDKQYKSMKQEDFDNYKKRVNPKGHINIRKYLVNLLLLNLKKMMVSPFYLAA